MVKKIIIIGGNVFNQDGPVLDFIKLCKNKNIEILLITDKIHLNYPTRTYGTFGQALKKFKVKFKVLNNFNYSGLKFLKQNFIPKESIIISMNSIWIFNKKMITYFKNVYNYHNADLPSQRGAACHSWNIMMNNFKSSLNIHLVNHKIDEGNLIFKKKILVPKYCLNLTDFYDFMRPLEINFFNDFLEKLKRGTLKIKKQKNKLSFYWPKLSTLKNGFIDWSWEAKDIISFSNAFDSPFQGVSTFLKNKKIILNKARLIDNNKKFHPFQSGLIYRKNKNNICVATKKGGVKFNLKIKKKIKLRVGDRLQTDMKNIYFSKGLF